MRHVWKSFIHQRTSVGHGPGNYTIYICLNDRNCYCQRLFLLNNSLILMNNCFCFFSCKERDQSAKGCESVSPSPFQMGLATALDPARDLQRLNTLIMNNLNSFKLLLEPGGFYSKEHISPEDMVKLRLNIKAITDTAINLDQIHRSYKANVDRCMQYGSRQAPIGDDNYYLTRGTGLGNNPSGSKAIASHQHHTLPMDKSPKVFIRNEMLRSSLTNDNFSNYWNEREKVTQKKPIHTYSVHTRSLMSAASGRRRERERERVIFRDRYRNRNRTKFTHTFVHMHNIRLNHVQLLKIDFSLAKPMDSGDEENIHILLFICLSSFNFPIDEPPKRVIRYSISIWFHSGPSIWHICAIKLFCEDDSSDTAKKRNTLAVASKTNTILIQRVLE